MYDGIRGGGSYWYSIFFVACVGLGQFVVLNLFLAVLLGNIDMIVSMQLPLPTSRRVCCGGTPLRRVLITRKQMFVNDVCGPGLWQRFSTRTQTRLNLVADFSGCLEFLDCRDNLCL